MESMKAAEIDAVIKFAMNGLRMLGTRILTLLSLAGAITLFAYASVTPDWIRVAGAALYAVLVYWPAMKLETKQGE